MKLQELKNKISKQTKERKSSLTDISTKKGIKNQFNQWVLSRNKNKQQVYTSLARPGKDSWIAVEWKEFSDATILKQFKQTVKAIERKFKNDPDFNSITITSGNKSYELSDEFPKDTNVMVKVIFNDKDY